MSVKEKLNSKFGIQDPLYISKFGGWSTTAFGYRDHGKVSNFVWDYETIEAEKDPQFGREVKFFIPKGSHLVGPCFLRWEMGALENSGAGDSRFVDFAGYRLIESITIKYGSNQIQNFEWPFLHWHHRIFKSRDMQEAHEVAVGGNLSTTQRNNLAAASQVFLTPLPLYWTEHIQKFLVNEALTGDLQIIVKIADQDNVTQTTSGTTTGSIDKLQLRMLSVYVEDHERDFHVDRTLVGAGEVMSINDYEAELSNKLTSGSTKYTIKLKNLKGPAYLYGFVLRKTSSLDDVGQPTYLPFDYEYFPDMSFHYDSAGVQLTRPMTGREAVYMVNPQFVAGPIGEPLYLTSPCLNPQDRISTYGHENFSGFTNPTLVLNFDSALSEDHYVDVFCFVRNTVQLDKGDLKKNFH